MKWKEERYNKSVEIGGQKIDLLGIWASGSDYDIRLLTVIAFTNGYPFKALKMSAEFWKFEVENMLQLSKTETFPNFQQLTNA